MKALASILLLGTLGMLGCSEGSNSSRDASDTTGISLALTTLGSNGTQYRLMPASFSIQQGGSTNPPLVVDASGDVSTVTVPVDPGTYSIKLQPGWQLNRVTSGSNTLTPVPATLTSPEEQTTNVNMFETSPITYRFHFGQSEIAIGLTVDEDPSDQYNDGRIVPTANGQYQIQFFRGGDVCCFASVEAARAAYPGLILATL
jgi:hypothetical protein